MIGEKKPNLAEKEPEIISAPPAVESLLQTSNSNSLWPENIKNNPEIARQADLRNSLLKDLDSIFKSIPQADMEIKKAVELGLVSEESLVEIYKKLIHFFESDPYNTRIILYFPFELIPQKEWAPKTDGLRGFMDEFTHIYMERWYGLLWVNDVRANFVDGDVLEVDLRDKPLERVTKSAHLIPKLVEKGILSTKDVIDLLEDVPDGTPRTSVVETLPVLVDLGFLTKEKMEEIIESHGLDLRRKEKNELPPEKVTEARAKWLTEKDEPVVITKKSENQLEESFDEKKERLKEDIEELNHIVKFIESNPELNSLVYPVVIMFGSKTKGYGADNADMDIAVFVRPKVEPQQRSKLKKLLAEVLSHEKTGGKFVEFWLKDIDGGGLGIIDFSSPDPTLADDSWSHVLFEGLWVGENKIIKEFHEKLLSGYLYSKGKKISGMDARRIWLEEMEKDTLQYRLLHKGYERFFPRIGGMEFTNSVNIDGQSTFYDSGYRRLATKLFLQKVFIPQI